MDGSGKIMRIEGHQDHFHRHQLNHGRSHNVGNLSNPDNADHALTSENDNRAMLLLNHIQRQIDDINGVLNRFEAGAYGICMNCGDNVD